jgi:hypothetical protein
MEPIQNTCPKCHSLNLKEYAYGLRRFASEAERATFLKTYIDAGCVIADDAPTYHCEDCQHDFGRMSDGRNQK